MVQEFGPCSTRGDARYEVFGLRWRVFFVVVSSSSQPYVSMFFRYYMLLAPGPRPPNYVRPSDPFFWLILLSHASSVSIGAVRCDAACCRVQGLVFRPSCRLCRSMVASAGCPCRCLSSYLRCVCTMSMQKCKDSLSVWNLVFSCVPHVAQMLMLMSCCCGARSDARTTFQLMLPMLGSQGRFRISVRDSWLQRPEFGQRHGSRPSCLGAKLVFARIPRIGPS